MPHTVLGTPMTLIRSRLSRPSYFMLLSVLSPLFAFPLPAQDLSEALDNPALVFQTSGEVPWITTTAETADGEDAARSGILAMGESSVLSVLETTVTGPGQVTFAAAIDTDGFNSGTFTIDDEYVRSIQPDITNEVIFSTYEQFIESGEHTLKWLFRLGVNSRRTDPRMILDQVRYDYGYQIKADSLGATVTASPSGERGFYPPGATVILTGHPLPGHEALGWFGDVISTNEVVSLTADANRELLFLASLPPGEAADNPELTFEQTGDLPWIGQTAYNHDGEDALLSPPLPITGGTSRLRVTVNGPGVLSFYHRAIGKKAGLRLAINSNSNTVSSSHTEDWKLFSGRLPAGPHVIEWRTNRTSFSDSEGQIVVDEIQYRPGYELARQGSLADKIILEPPGGTYPPGTTVTLTAVAEPGQEVKSWWTNRITEISGMEDNPVSLTITDHTQVQVSFRLTVPYALDAPELPWTTSHLDPWSGFSNDLETAAVSSGGVNSWLETTLNGPGTLRYDVSALSPDSVEVSLDGSPQHLHSNRDTATILLPIPPGPRTIRWTVVSEDSHGAGHVSLDNVLFLGTDSLGAWRKFHFGAEPAPANLAGLLRDPDHDGRPNWLELACASDPNVLDFPPSFVDGGEIRFRTLIGVYAISSQVEKSFDLSDWKLSELIDLAPLQIMGATYLESAVSRSERLQFYRQIHRFHPQ